MNPSLSSKNDSPRPTASTNDVVSILDIGVDNEEAVSSKSRRKKRGDYGQGVESTGVWGFYKRLNERIESISPVNIRDKVAFFQLLAIMIDAGVPLVRALYVLSQQLNNARMRRIVAALAQKVESGKPLSAALQDFYGIFDDAQIGMIRAGEVSGKLNEILQQIADQVEKSAKLTSKVKGAMIYPAVILCLMGGVIFVVLGFVIPQLMELFTEANATLPKSTLFLIYASEFVQGWYKEIIAGFILAGGVFYLWKRTPSGKYRWHQLLLRVPLFGKLFRYVALTRFTRTLSSLIQSGVPIVKSLQINADAIGNEVYRRRIYMAAEDVSRGIPLAEHLMDSPFLFPEMVVSMISIGEQTAELDQVSKKIAEYYDGEVDQMAANMSKLMEPFILVVMGVVVGTLVMAIMQPIFGLLDVVGSL